jgi:hypothetical protein
VLLAIGCLTPAGNVQNQYQVVAVVNIINHTIIAHPDVISLLYASYLSDSLRARFLG